VAKINAGSGGDGLAGDDWMVLEFESEPTFPLELERLDRKGGIELLSVRERGSATLATVLVPEGRLQVFEKLVQEYLTKQTDTGKPKNEAFLANIAAIRLAVLESLWTDEGPLPKRRDAHLVGGLAPSDGDVAAYLSSDSGAGGTAAQRSTS
jgi:hypothetical protein